MLALCVVSVGGCSGDSGGTSAAPVSTRSESVGKSAYPVGREVLVGQSWLGLEDYWRIVSGVNDNGIAVCMHDRGFDYPAAPPYIASQGNHSGRGCEWG